MEQLKNNPPEEETRHVYTVSELTQDIKLVLESSFAQVWVEGEVSNFQVSSAGHTYFTLKDDAGVLPSAMFSRVSKEVKFKIENGLKVICFGKVSAYTPRGQYQIIVEKIEPKGIGALQLALEQLKKKLEKEGLFSLEHKRAIPYLPRTVGIVTSPTGAAIKDILKVLDRRFSDIHVIVSPAQVQGPEAGLQIARAIGDLNILNDALPQQERPEVMIVGRGGGSIEDLWAFNEEIVARAIYNSKIPIISAVGHERDWTIADLVADVRAATPSVAAEMVIPRKEDLRDKTKDLLIRLHNSWQEISQGYIEKARLFLERLYINMQHRIELTTGILHAIGEKLSLLNPAALLEQHFLRVNDLAKQIQVRMRYFIAIQEAEFVKASGRLASLSPLQILSRGYSITFKTEDSSIIKEARNVKVGDAIKTRLHKGEILSKVTEVEKNG